MRHQRDIISIWCMIILTIISSLTLVLPISAQYDAFPFVVGTANGPGKLDPLDAYDSESIETIMQVCEGLYMYNYSSPEMESIPCLASNMGTWSTNASGDLVVLDIPLKQGVTFHDGSKFNASAAKWNFDRLQYWTYGWDIDGGDIYTAGDGIVESNPLGTASKSLFAQEGKPILNHTEIIDEFTLRFVLNVESVIWEKLLALIACAMVLPDPDYAYGDIFLNRIDINDELIGTGPFMLTDYEFDDKVVFDYFPDYHMTWGNGHIKRMIYLIVPDDTARSLAILNHEIHWGSVISDYDEQFAADPDLVELPVKVSVVYYIQMNLYNMLSVVRYASSFIWNHTFFLVDALGGVHYELHVPVPDGMQYHHEGFAGEPHYDVDTARHLILDYESDGSAAGDEFVANITASGLSGTSTDQDWIDIAESQTPIAEFNYTRYESGTVEFCGNLLQTYLKDIGIKLNILDAIPWDDWVKDYLENSTGHHRLAYSFGGWGPDYNDPINMIEPLYGTGARSNCFGLANSTWNQKLIDTYSVTGAVRQNLFYDIQEDFVKYQIPSFYILQLGGFISFNKAYLEEDSIGDLKNLFNDLYWFNCKFGFIDSPSPPIGLIIIFSILAFIAITVVGTLILAGIGTLFVGIGRGIKKLVEKHTIIQEKKSFSQPQRYCTGCGSKEKLKNGICVYCGEVAYHKIKETDALSLNPSNIAPKYCPDCGSDLINLTCSKCGKTLYR